MRRHHAGRHLCAVVVIIAISASLHAGDSLAQADPEHPTSHLNGPGSVAAQIKIDEERRGAQDPKTSRPRMKDRLREDYGLTLGADYNTLYQGALGNEGDDDAAGGALRVYGHWTLVDHGTSNRGALVFKFENRHNHGNLIPPQDLGPGNGYLGLTSLTFSDAGNSLTNLYWSQAISDDRFAWIAGIVDVTDYIDVFGLSNPWTDFNNSAFATNPTIPAPGQGLGAAMGWRISPHYYVVTGLADANGDPTHPEDMFDSFFDSGEHFYHVELGWIASMDKRIADNVHVFAWQVDERKEAGIDDGWGITFSYSRTLAERWSPFLRGGYAEGGGAPLQRSISVGTGYQFEWNDYLGIGASWGRPPDAADTGEENQYTLEAFYRTQAFTRLQVMPGVQYLINPGLDASADNFWVLSLKLRIFL